jgi:hypothetical protein
MLIINTLKFYCNVMFGYNLETKNRNRDNGD